MTAAVQITGAILLFLLGVRLSALFSGAETGFYRLSFLRLTIDAHAGDAIAKRLRWFARRPSYFVATTLVGNNVANYLTTLALGVAIAGIFVSGAWWLEIVGTLLFAPLIFFWGELIPKALYYRAPLTLLRKEVNWFRGFYWLFLPLSLPLIGITRLFQRFSRAPSKPLELVLGRSRLVQVLSEGHREGLLTEVQSTLIHGLMNIAGQSVQTAMTPDSRVLAIASDASREEVLGHARRYGLTEVPLRSPDNPPDYAGYFRVADLRIARDALATLILPMPAVAANVTRLEALLALREAGAQYGRVIANGTVVGIINERGLIEQMFRPAQALPPR